MTEQFAIDVLSIPTTSKDESMMVEFVQEWASSHGVSTSIDSAGNLYLTKGSARFFPCVTAHLDTVQVNQLPTIEAHEKLIVKKQGRKLVASLPDGTPTGIGADCKAGIAICLAIMASTPACKCALFSQEELGAVGSRKLDKSFFEDVSYVIGFDSPEQARASKSCNRVPLFNDEFFNAYVKDVAAQHGVSKFYDDPGTDVMNIRKMTRLVCMNFGNGGYHAHMKDEYAIVADMDKAEKLGLSLVQAIPHDKQHTCDDMAIAWKQPSYYDDWLADDVDDEGFDDEDDDLLAYLEKAEKREASKSQAQWGPGPSASKKDASSQAFKPHSATSFWDWIQQRKDSIR